MYHQGRGQDRTGRGPTRQQNEQVTATHNIPVPRDRHRIAIYDEVVYSLALFQNAVCIIHIYMS